MKILHISSDIDVRNGIETATMDTILALHELGVKQFVVCRPNDDFLRPLCKVDIPFEVFDFNKWNKWFAQRRTHQRILRIIKSYTPDILHCWGERSATFIPKGSGVVSLGWDFGYGLYNLKYDAVCDYYIGTRHEFIERLEELTKRPDCVFQGHIFGDLPEDAPLSREEFGIPDDKPVILMLARMNPVKGVDVLLRASVELNAFLLLAGTGPEMENYQKLARDLAIESRVHFIGWRNDRAALLDLSDVLAIPSRRDSAPAVMSQAWYKGVPLVASNINGLREHIEHGVNGMLSDIDDVDGLAKNLRAVLEDANLRERLIAGGTHAYKTQFSKEVVINNLLEIYREIIRRGVSI